MISIVYVEISRHGRGFSGQIPNVSDHIGGAAAVPDDAFNSLFRLIEIRRVSRQPQHSGFGVCQHGGKWLDHFVDDAHRALVYRHWLGAIHEVQAPVEK